MTGKDLYREISRQKNDLPLFHKDWWLDTICTEWDAVVVKKGENVAGVWPYCIEKKLGITISRNPALTPYMGPHVFFPKDLKESKRDSFEHEIITELIKYLPSIDVCAIACRPGLKQVGLFKDKGFDAIFRQTFIMNLEGTTENILARLHEDCRRSIKKADAEITITDEPDMMPLLHEYQKATLDRKETTIAFSLQQMEQLHSRCREHNATALWVARKNGEIQAILWNMWDDVRAYYLVGSKNPGVRDNHAMPALLWQAAKHAHFLGKISLDFEGSMIPGVERFFRNFGAERILYPVLQQNNSFLWKAIKLIRR